MSSSAAAGNVPQLPILNPHDEVKNIGLFMTSLDPGENLDVGRLKQDFGPVAELASRATARSVPSATSTQATRTTSCGVA